MKIVTCIKRVPDTEARLKIGAGGAIDTTGAKFIISPYDEYALEAGFRLRDAQGSGEVIALSVGDASSAEQLRSALAMGADRALLLKGQTSIDGLATAKAIAAELKDAAPDLVLLGMKAVDNDQQQTGPMLAEILGFPCITAASDIVIEDGKVVCHREIEGGVEVVEAPLPAVVSMTKGENEPRYPSLKGIMAAKKKPLDEKDAQIEAGRIRIKDMSPPSERPAGRVVGQGKDAVPELVRLLRDEAKVL